VAKQVKQLDRVVIRFAGDSGDGMQLTGDRFTSETAAFGNDLSTLPNYPAEIRAPAGTMHGVSSFQLHFADHDILTPGDAPDVLVAMNPAALRANVGDLARGATVIVDNHDFGARNLARAGYAANPLEDGSLDAFAVHSLDLTTLTVEGVKEFGLTRKDAARAKNMFALGLLSWLYGRPTQPTVEFIEAKFAKRTEIRDANVTAFRAGWNFGETTETFAVSYEVKPAPMERGTYRNITGNLALAYGLVAAAHMAQLPLFLGAYPITPASDLLHELRGRHPAGVGHRVGGRQGKGRTQPAQAVNGGADRRRHAQAAELRHIAFVEVALDRVHTMRRRPGRAMRNDASRNGHKPLVRLEGVDGHDPHRRGPEQHRVTRHDQMQSADTQVCRVRRMGVDVDIAQNPTHLACADGSAQLLAGEAERRRLRTEERLSAGDEGAHTGSVGGRTQA